MTRPSRRTAVVEGPLAYAMRRLAAARGQECGLQIVTLPQLAGRLAGGFFVPATADLVEPAVQRALAREGLVDLVAVAQLPGMTRAATTTLQSVWDADVDLAAMRLQGGPPRWSDLASIEESVRRDLPPAAKLPRDLRDLALARIAYAPCIIGPVRIEGLSWIAPVWRTLINDLCSVVAVEWHAPLCADVSWFTGTIVRLPATRSTVEEIVTCADPRHEVVEGLRWARQLMSLGRAQPFEIAISAASTSAWDDHMLALAKDSDIRIHFSHGILALSTRDGQRCAALCDLLLRGLSEGRVRRLASLCAGEPSPFDRLPEGWISALPRGATLLTVGEWRRAILQIAGDAPPLQGAEQLIALLEKLARGPSAAIEAGNLFLAGRSRQIWETALRNAPPQALELTLKGIRLPDQRDASASVVWCPASHLAAAPRAWTRLLGLTARAWPRRLTEDSLLPHHIVSRATLETDPQPEADRRHFSAIVSSAHGGIAFSRSRRNAQGNRQSPSPLSPRGPAEVMLSRTRIPQHAFSEVDRLMVRPREAMTVSLIQSASQCWRNWHRSDLTAHDGRFSAEHPALQRAITRVQSPTSLRLMLRAPLGFVWRYALDWQAPEEPERPLTISANQFGRLVHELLRRAVDTLEAGVGLASANDAEIETALQGAGRHIQQAWPLLCPVPPALLWSSTIEYAVRLSLEAFKLSEATQADTRSWTEVRFGDPDAVASERPLPWDPTAPVTIPGTEVRVRGTIDRLDLRTSRPAARVTDYKTGERPKRPLQVIIGGGNELQRTLYGLACRQLLTDHAVRARLIYLPEPPLIVDLDDLDAALEKTSQFVTAVCLLLRQGVAVPGPDAAAKENDLRLASPASPSYLRRKQASLARAANSISTFWGAR